MLAQDARTVATASKRMVGTDRTSGIHIEMTTTSIAITEKVTVLPSVLDAPSIRALQPPGLTDSFGPRERVRSSACRSVESRRPSHRYSTTVSRAE